MIHVLRGLHKEKLSEAFRERMSGHARAHTYKNVYTIEFYTLCHIRGLQSPFIMRGLSGEQTRKRLIFSPVKEIELVCGDVCVCVCMRRNLSREPAFLYCLSSTAEVCDVDS